MKKWFFVFGVGICMLTNVWAANDCANSEQNCWDCGKTAGDLCTARLNTETQELNITGTGEMRDYWAYYETETNAPWGWNYTSVTVDGVKNVGANAFRGNGHSGFTSASISDSVESIGEGAFAENFSLTDVKLGDSITHIDAYAFGGDFALASVVIPDSLMTVTVVETTTCDNCVSGIFNFSGTSVSGKDVTYYCPQEKLTLCTQGGGSSYVKAYTKDNETGVYVVDGVYYASPDAMMAQSSCGMGSDIPQQCIDDANAYQEQKALSMANGALCDTKTACLHLMDMAREGAYCATIAACHDWVKANGNHYRLQTADGSSVLYDSEGNFVSYKGKRIYTIEEANEVAKPTGNTVRIKYR